LSSPFFQAKVDWLASFRGRIGWAWDDRNLLYATGGLALAQLKSNDGMTGFTNYTATLNTTKAGWVVGGGIEHRLTKNWSVMGEVLYYDFGHTGNTSAPSTGAGSGFVYQTDFVHTIVQGKLGLNYRF
jgi:outer membrane immunogenic protein